ncbi:MAG: GTP-binding protein, partial [Bacillota bacterium]
MGKYSSHEIATRVGKARAAGWKHLNLSACEVQDQDLHEILTEPGIEQLASLDLFGNRLTALPPQISRLAALAALHLGINRLTALPPEIGQLTALTDLYILHNQLTALPPEIGQLAALTELDLRGNRLTVLPPQIGQLTALMSLYLQNNHLTGLTPEASRLIALKGLWLHGNGALGIPPEILGPTWEEVQVRNASPASPATILDYYFRTRLAARPLNEAKMILVGRGEVGKTSLVRRLLGKGFDPKQGKTQGIQIAPWPLSLRPHEKVLLHIWDFGGQEIMHATHQF